jgi:hypothetical protein
MVSLNEEVSIVRITERCKSNKAKPAMTDRHKKE